MKGTGATVTVLNKAAIAKEKMGLLEAVGKGARDGAAFIVIEYWGYKKPVKGAKVDEKSKPVILIGKGITYDTGGLNVKPAGSMHEMHLDMSGGGSVIGAMRAIAKLGLKKNVVGLIPAAENAVSALSMRAGDIATSMSGQTVEILHTDAEGRLVLADAMTYAQKYYTPKVMVDIATLTGAALVALGQQASVIMTKDLALQTTLIELGETSGDLVWPLPLWDEYKASLKSSRADISNIATNFARWGGTIEGGTFLSFFANKNVPWVHIDMAPRMESIASDKLAKGATGEPVRLLVSYVESTV
jgi:leucyl aminopeptidase